MALKAEKFDFKINAGVSNLNEEFRRRGITNVKTVNTIPNGIDMITVIVFWDDNETPPVLGLVDRPATEIDYFVNNASELTILQNELLQQYYNNEITQLELENTVIYQSDTHEYFHATANVNNVYTFNTFNTGNGPVGPKGEKGDPGQPIKGDPGDKGETGYGEKGDPGGPPEHEIEEASGDCDNGGWQLRFKKPDGIWGNWIIICNGEDGEPGAQGPQGEKGEAGTFPSGYSGTVDVVTDVTYNEEYCIFTVTKKQLTFTGGGLTGVANL